MEAEILHYVPYLVVKKDNTIVKCSNKILEIFNINENELLNKNLLNIFKELSFNGIINIDKNFELDENFVVTFKNQKTFKFKIFKNTESSIIVFDDVTNLKQREFENIKVNALLENVFNLSTEAIRIIDNEFNIIKANNSYFNLQNHSEDDEIEQKCYDTLCFDICNTDNCVLKQIHAKKNVSDKEICVEIYNEKKYFILTAKPYIANNEVLGIVESLKDVTEIKNAYNEINKQNRLRELIINNIPSSISFIDTNEKYKFVNKQYYNIFGKETEEVEGSTIKEVHKSDYNIIKPYIDKALKGILSNYQTEIEIDSRGKRWFEITFAPDFDDLNNIRGFIVLTHDITEIKNYEFELLKSKEKYKLIANNTNDIIWTLDKNGKFLFISPSVQKIRGFSVEEAMKQSLKESLTEDSYNIAKPVFNETIIRISNGEKNIESKVFLLKQPHKNGSAVDMEIIVNTVFDDNNNFRYFIGVSRDISSRISEFSGLEKSIYQNVISNVNHGFALLKLDKDRNVYFLETNSKFEEIIQKDKNDLIKLKFDDIFNGIDISAFINYEQISSNSNILHENYFYKPLQKNFNLQIFSPQPEYIAICIEDITNSKTEENELRKVLERYKYVHKNIDEIIYVLDSNNCVSFMSGAYDKFFNVKNEQVTGKNIFYLIDKYIEDENCRNILKSNYKSTKNQGTFQFEIKDNNTVKYYDVNFKIIYDNAGNLIGSSGIIKNITDIKSSYQKLLKSEEKLRKAQEVLNEISEYTSDFYGKTDAEGKIVYVSPSIKNVLGFLPEIMIGRSIFDFIDTSEIPKAIENKTAFLSGLKNRTTIYKTQKADGNYVWLEVKANILFDENNITKGMIASYRDITDRVKYQQSLKENEERYKIVTDNIPDIIYSIDNEFKFNFIAGNVKNILGFEPENIKGKTISELYSLLNIPDSKSKISDLNMMLIIKKKLPDFESVFKIEKNNDFLFLENKGTIIYNEQTGKVDKINGIIRDITNRKVFENRLNRLTLAVNQSPTSILITDINGKIQYVNLKFCETTGYDATEVVGLHIRELKSGKNPAILYKNLWDTITSGKVWQNELINKKKNGDFFYEKVYLYPLKDENGKIINFIGMKEDITQTKVIEKALENERIELKITLDDLKEKNNEIEAHKEKLIELNATKDKFLSIIGHDLKNPIGSLYNFSQLLINHYDEYDKVKILNLIKIISEASKSSLNLIENLLAWARTQTGKISFNPERINIKNIINEVISELKAPIENKNISINSHNINDLFLNIDKNMITTVFRNVLSNAVKYSYKGGIVEISMINPDNFLNISIIDKGTGICEEDLKKIFSIDKPFSNPGTENERGTGLGLVLCKEFIERHKGKILVESNPGKGSKFTILLPVN